MQMELFPDGRGQAVIIVGIVPGSAAEAAGLRPGHKVLAVSDPNRNEMWQLRDRPSLRFVRDAIRMKQGPTVELVVQVSAGNKGGAQFRKAK